MSCCINQVDLRTGTQTVTIECQEDFPRIKVVTILAAAGEVESSFSCDVGNGVVAGLDPNFFGSGADRQPTEEEKALVRDALVQLREDGIFDEHNKCRCPHARLRLY